MSARVLIKAEKRFVPLLEVSFAPVWGPYQVALIGIAKLAVLQDNYYESINVEQSETLFGSIYFEDREEQTIRDFVSDLLKAAYKKWEREDG